MAYGFGMFFALIMLFGTGPHAGNDLLDTIPTTAYWDSKHVNVTEAQLEADAGPAPKPEHVVELVQDLESPEYRTRTAAKKRIVDIGPAALPLLWVEAQSTDPEVKAAAEELITQLSNHAKERDVRQLMAIRTLGERKEARAVPMLTVLVGSKKGFIAAYASRAIAQIQGKEQPLVDRRAAMNVDLNLLSSATGVVAQTIGLAHEPLTVEAIVDMATAQAQAIAGRQLPKRAAMVRRAVVEVLKLAERIGDIRVDGITVGVSSDVGSREGTATILVRGEYDRASAADAIKATISPDSPKLEVRGGVILWETGGDMTLVMPSNEQLAIVLGEPVEKRRTAIDDLLAAIKTGKGTLAQNQDITALMKMIDTQAPLWVAARLNKDMRVGVLQGFDSVTLVTKAETGKTAFTFFAHGMDGEKVKSSVEELNTEITGAIAQAKMVAATYEGAGTHSRVA